MGKVVETRKLVKWGSSKTLIMSLPRSWTKKHNLTEANEVQVLENADGSLLILPLDLGLEKEVMESEIKSEQYPESQTLSYMVKTKFLDGSEIIKIKSKTAFTESRYQEITDIVSQLIGFEILSKTTNEIVLKDIMALKETSIEELVKMVSNTVLELMGKLLEAINPLDVSTLEAIYNSEDNVHKYYLRVHRQLRKALIEPLLLTKMNITAQDAVDYAFFIVELNDIAVNLASMSYVTKKYGEEQSIGQTDEILQSTYNILKEAISSFLFRNTKEALAVLSKIDGMKKRKREIETVLDKLTAEQPTTASQIILDNSEKIMESTFSIGLTALRRAKL